MFHLRLSTMRSTLGVFSLRFQSFFDLYHITCLCPLLPYPPRWLTYSSDLLPETVVPFNSNRPRGRRPYFHRWCYWQSRLSKVDRFNTMPLAPSHLFFLLFSYASFERQPHALSIGAYFVHNRPNPCAYSALTALAIRNPFGLVIPWSPDWAFL